MLSPDFVKALTAEKDLLRARKRRINKALSAVDALLECATPAEQEETQVSESDADDSQMAPYVGERIQGKSVKDEIYDILLSGNGPIHRSVIYDRLVERGLRIGGLGPIRSHLSNDERFTSMGKGMWKLANPSQKQPNPVAEPDDNGNQNTDGYEEEEDVPW